MLCALTVKPNHRYYESISWKGGEDHSPTLRFSSLEETMANPPTKLKSFGCYSNLWLLFRDHSLPYRNDSTTPVRSHVDRPSKDRTNSTNSDSSSYDSKYSGSERRWFRSDKPDLHRIRALLVGRFEHGWLERLRLLFR